MTFWKLCFGRKLGNAFNMGSKVGIPADYQLLLISSSLQDENDGMRHFGLVCDLTFEDTNWIFRPRSFNRNQIIRLCWLGNCLVVSFWMVARLGNKRNWIGAKRTLTRWWGQHTSDVILSPTPSLYNIGIKLVSFGCSWQLHSIDILFLSEVSLDHTLTFFSKF